MALDIKYISSELKEAKTTILAQPTNLNTNYTITQIPQSLRKVGVSIEPLHLTLRSSSASL